MLRYVVCLCFATPLMAQDAVEAIVAQQVLAQLQPLSFAKEREYCGYIGYDSTATLVAGPATPGTRAGCSAEWPEDLAVTASYHTHGTYDQGYFNEVPSDVDVEGDHEFLVDGYVSTPGGRLWHVDGRAMIVRQICGIGCLPVAPGFVKGRSGAIRDQYTIDELRILLGD